MFVRRLRLTNLRCRHELEVKLDEGLNILVGPNGAGKTTVLEAATLVLLGTALRTSNIRDLISRDRDFLRVELDLENTGADVVAAAAYGRNGERRFTAAGALLDDAARWKGLLPVRTFAPDDLRLIKGSPRRRREYLDNLASRSHPEYSETLRRYEEALSQRNFLLRTFRGSLRDPDFDPWEALLATTGLRVSSWRAAALAGFVGGFQRTHEELTGDAAEDLRLTYRTNVIDLDESDYRSRLLESRAADRQRTYTQLGPHRDDLRLLRDGLDVRECASQGEQRTALLALVLAEWEGLLVGPAPPLLLLDDVMSELDPSRRHRLLALTRRGGQTVITTTDRRYFSPEELEMAHVVDLEATDCQGGGN